MLNCKYEELIRKVLNKAYPLLFNPKYSNINKVNLLMYERKKELLYV